MEKWKVFLALALLAALIYLALGNGKNSAMRIGQMEAGNSAREGIVMNAAGQQPQGINITEKDIPKITLPSFNLSLPNISGQIAQAQNASTALQNASSIEAAILGTRQAAENVSASDIKFTSIDGTDIYGTIFTPTNRKAKGGVLLLHQLGMDRRSFDAFGAMLAQEGYAALSIDMRGSGQSAYRGGAGTFSTDDFLMVKKDMRWGIDVLRDRAGMGNDAQVQLVGASIGANLALQYAAENPLQITSVALLSPGLDYRGVKSADAAAAYSGRMLALASDEDGYSADSVRELGKINLKIETGIYSGLGHGAEMLGEKAVQNRIIGWIGG